MTNKEIQELKERVYAISYSGFPLDTFFNDIRNVSDPRFNEMAAYRDLKLIVDEIYDLREKAKKYKDKETPKKVEMKNKVFTDYNNEGVFVGEYEYETADCPHCGKEIYDEGEGFTHLLNADYCPKCGGKLDWSENNE